VPPLVERAGLPKELISDQLTPCSLKVHCIALAELLAVPMGSTGVTQCGSGIACI